MWSIVVGFLAVIGGIALIFLAVAALMAWAVDAEDMRGADE